MKYQPNLIKKCTPFLHCISSSDKVLFIKNYKAQRPVLSLFFTLAFTSADIIFPFQWIHSNSLTHYLPKYTKRDENVLSRLPNHHNIVEFLVCVVLVVPV